MIILYSGTPGSGKSLHLAKDIKNWIEIYKQPVLANFVVNTQYIKHKGNGGFCYLDNNYINPDFLIWFSNIYRKVLRKDRVPEESILLVIDEAQLLFNVRNWNDKNRAAWVSFFSQHRKMGYKIILVAQYAEMIDKQIRALIEYEYIHRKVKNIGFMGKFLNAVSLGSLHVAIKMYRPLNEKVATDFYKGNKLLYALYDSYNRFSAV